MNYHFKLATFSVINPALSSGSCNILIFYMFACSVSPWAHKHVGLKRKCSFFQFHENSANDFRILERSDLQRSKLYMIFQPLSTHPPLLKVESGRGLLPAVAILDVLLYHTVGQRVRRQSAKLFLQSSELGIPHPSHARECVPPPPPSFGSGGRGTLACGRGGGRVPIRTKGQTLWYSRYICTLCLGSSQPPPCLLSERWSLRKHWPKWRDWYELLGRNTDIMRLYQ
jgi:hypothetical protein